MWKTRSAETLGELERAVAELRRSLPASAPLRMKIVIRDSEPPHFLTVGVSVAKWVDPDGNLCVTKSDSYFEKKKLTVLKEKVVFIS